MVILRESIIYLINICSILRFEHSNKNKNHKEINTRNYNEHKKIYPSLINISFKNKKLEESLNSQISINKTQKISPSTTLKNSQPENRLFNIKSIKQYANKRKNFIKSAIDFYKRKNHEKYFFSSLNKTKEKNEIKNIDYENTTKNMFDELDIINKTLSKESQPNQRRIIKILNNENKYEQDYILSKDLKKILNKDKINSILKKETTKCDFSKIRNNSSINIFRKKISKSILNRNENSLHPKKINSLILSNSNQTTTRLLDRKTINGLPVTFPLYLSHNRTFSSIGEKNRIEKIISKLVCLKTYNIKR